MSHNFSGYGIVPPRASTELTSMECFDLLGPKTRKVINEAKIMFSPSDCWVNLALRRGISDEDLAELLRIQERRITAMLEREREELKGIWSLEGFSIKQRVLAHQRRASVAN